MNSDCVLIKQDDNGIVTLTLNRPDRHNAFNEDVINSLQVILDTINHDSAVRVVIIQANGKNFSAGADLEWMKKMIHYSHDDNVKDAMTLMNLLKTLASLKKPTIALVQGSAFGGGVGLLACCDIVIAEEDANFCFSEAKLGLVPATIAPYVIRAIGLRNTQYLFLTAKKFDVSVAQRIGLIHEIVPQGKLSEVAEQHCAHLLANGPKALSIIKNWLVRIQPNNDQALIESAELIADVRISDEAQEGLSAFFEKRKAQWTL